MALNDLLRSADPIASAFSQRSDGLVISTVKSLLESLEGPELPFMRPVSPPRRQRRRPTSPFDFFGTAFASLPQTQALNPIAQLNQSF